MKQNANTTTKTIREIKSIDDFFDFLKDEAKEAENDKKNGYC